MGSVLMDASGGRKPWIYRERLCVWEFAYHIVVLIEEHAEADTT